MAWGGKKEELIAKLAAAEAKVESLNDIVEYQREEISNLRIQLSRTQEALIAKEAPEAYLDHKLAEEDAKPLTEEEVARRGRAKKQSEMDKKLLEEMEAPLFKDAEDMQDMLKLALFKEPEALHGNSES